MKKTALTNRDYTGLERTPSSMSWLIRKKSLAQGRLQRYLRDLDRLPQQIVEARAEIEALDLVMRVHDTKVDPAEIQPTIPKRQPLVERGQLIKSIYRCLRQANGQPMYTTEIAMQVARILKYEITRFSKPLLVKRVGNCLFRLRAQGNIAGHHDTNRSTGAEGQWSLVVSEDEDATQLG
jgi:hypothetical protein